MISSRHSSPRYSFSPSSTKRCSKANSRTSSRGSSIYSSPCRYFSPSQRIPSFLELSLKSFSDLSKVRNSKLSKIIEIEAKEKMLHKKLLNLLNQETKSYNKKKSNQLKAQGDQRLSWIMKESAQNLLELEGKAKKLIQENSNMKERLGIKSEVNVNRVIDALAEKGEFEDIEVERNEHYLLCIDDIAEIILHRFGDLTSKDLTKMLAGNVQSERIKMKQVIMENQEILKRERNSRQELEERVKRLVRRVL